MGGSPTQSAMEANQMSGLAWIRLDTGWPRNPKILALLSDKEGYRAAVVYISSLCYSGEQGTDGYIPTLALGSLHGRPSDAERLIKVGLWMPLEHGYQINDWAEYQQTSEVTKARSERAKALAAKRWKGQPDPF